MTTECVQVKLEIGHKASIRAKETPEGFTHDWTVFVRGPEGSNVQHFVERVVFQLHESFPKPKRVVKEPPYQVSESGYAGFILPIEVVFKNKEEPKKVVYNYDLYLQLEGPPINPARIEKLTFQNPTEDFRRKLIKGGGVGIVASEGGTILNHPQHIPSKLSPTHSSTSQGSNPSGTYKKQISEAIKAPKSSTGQSTATAASAAAPTDGSSAPRHASSSSSSTATSSSSASSASSSPASQAVSASTVVPVPATLPAITSIFAKKNRRAEDDILKTVASHSHIPTSFVDLFGQPIKRSRCSSPETSKVLKDQHHKSTSLSSKSSKPSASSSSSSTTLSSSAASKESIASGTSSSSNRSSSASSKGQKTPKASSATAPSTTTTGATARAKDSKSQSASRSNSNSEKRSPSPPPVKSVDSSSKKQKHSGAGARSPSTHPSSSSKAKDFKEKRSTTVQVKEKHAHKSKRSIDDSDGADVKAKERKSVEEKSSAKGQAKSLKRVKRPPSATTTPSPPSSNLLNVSDGRSKSSRTTPSPASQRSPLPDANDVADASPSSSISFSSLPGHGSSRRGGGGRGGGSGPLGALMAELVDEDDFLSPLSSDAETPVEADGPSTPPSPPLPTPPPPPSPPRHVGEKHKVKTSGEKNNQKSRKTVSDLTPSTKKTSSSSSSSVISKSQHGRHLTDETVMTSSAVHVVSTTDEQKKDEYIDELRDLQERIMAIKDRSHLQRIVNVIEETGLYQVTSTTFDFDLCTLDRNTVKKLQTCLATT